MGPEDVADCTDVFAHASAALRTSMGGAPSTRRPVATEARIAYLQQHDPAGSWIARGGGAIVGFAQAAVREKLWVLAHLFVAPEHQAQGVGNALLQRAHELSLSVPIGIISSSPD